MIGHKIGSYKIVGQLGSGGMGEVFEAVHEKLQRRAAIKVLHPHVARAPEMAARFRNEARAVNIIRHPGVVDIYEHGQLEDGTVYIVMEYLEGQSLGDYVTQHGRVSESQVVVLCQQIASALAAAHNKNIIHRDLKPDNVMLVTDPAVPGGVRAKLLDFGIAKMLGDTVDRPSQQTQTRTGALMGTPVYMSPEQCRGAGGVGDRSDVYSLGVVMFHILVGSPPFQAVGTGELMAKHMSELPPRLHDVAPEVSEPLAQLVDSMLRKEPAERPSMGEIELELARQSGVPIGSLVTGAQPIALTSREQVRTNNETTPGVDPFRSTIGGMAAADPLPKTPKRSRLSLRVLTGGAAAGLLLAGVVGVSWWRSTLTRTAELLHQAQAEVQARRWDDAESHLSEAMGQRGVTEEQRRLAEKLRRQIGSERVARELLLSMEGLEKTGQPEESARLFRKLPVDSVYAAAGKEVYERAAARLLATQGGALEVARQSGRCDEWQQELRRIAEAIDEHPALGALRARGCVATQLTEAEQRTRAEATELLQRWLAAHNLGRAAELPTLYATKALGLRRVSGRLSVAERDRWLAERAEHLRRPTSLALTGEARVLAITSAAILAFPYTWDSSVRKEAGHAELLLLREPGGLRIAREELTPSQTTQQAPPLPHPPEELAFLGGMELLLPTPIDEAWAIGAPRLEPGTDPLRVTRDVDPAKLPAEVLRWRGRTVGLWDLSGRRCEAKVATFKVVGRLRPNAVLMQAWQATGTAAATEAWRLSSAGRSLGAVLEGDPAACAGALWARLSDEQQPPPKLGTVREAPAPLRMQALRELQKLPLNAELQALVPRRPGVRSWDQGKETSVQVLTLTHGATQLLSLSAKIGAGCAGVSHQFWVLWRRQPDGRTYKLATMPRGLPGGVPRAVVDLDGNGEPEVLFTPGGPGELFGVLRARAGIYSDLDIDRVPALDSGC
jgi:serine/threonine protein kinase